MTRASQRGAALAEFAIVSLAALTLIFGVIEFGRAVYMYHLVSDVARQGARYAVVNGAAACPGGSPSPDPLQAYVASQAPLAGPGALMVTTSCAAPIVCATATATGCSNTNGCAATVAPFNSAGCLVSVTVSYAFHFIVPLVSNLTPVMSSTSTMAISR